MDFQEVFALHLEKTISEHQKQVAFNSPELSEPHAREVTGCFCHQGHKAVLGLATG